MKCRTKCVGTLEGETKKNVCTCSELLFLDTKDLMNWLLALSLKLTKSRIPKLEFYQNLTHDH